jgi:hypothetical protein
MEKKDIFTCPHCGEEIEPSLLNKWKAAQVGRGTSEKKAASSAENGKKGGRPKISTMLGFQVTAIKNGEFHILMLVPTHVTGSGAKAEYKLVICYPGGTQADAEYQPVNDGNFPDIELLAEKNGFETVDIRSFKRPF